MNRNYEVMFIVRPDMVDEDLNKLIATLESSVTSSGGTTKSEVWGKRRLAYRVGKFNDGIFVLMMIEATGAIVHEVERRLRVTEPVIKFLTVRTDEELKRLDKESQCTAGRNRRSNNTGNAGVAGSGHGNAGLGAGLGGTGFWFGTVFVVPPPPTRAGQSPAATQPNSQKAGALWQKKQKHQPRLRDQATAKVAPSAVEVIAPSAADRAVRVPAEALVVPAKAAANSSGARRFASFASRRSRPSITKMCVCWRSSLRKAAKSLRDA